MSSLEERRSSPRREPAGPGWSIGVFLAGFCICCGVGALVVAMLLSLVIQQPKACIKIANAMPLAGDCR